MTRSAPDIDSEAGPDLVPVRAPGRWQAARIVRVEAGTPSIRRFFIELSQPFAFVAGQHVDIRLTAEDGYQARRSYSIASAPEEGGPIELAIERLADGEISPYFHDVAQPGDEIELRGPIGGHFIWSPLQEGPHLFIGGGSGIVPLASMLHSRHAAAQASPACLVHSARTSADLLYRDSFERMQQRDDGFAYMPTITRASDTADSGGIARGRVDAGLLREALRQLAASPRLVYVCGRNAFVEAIAQGLITLDVPAASIRTERFGG